MELQLKSLSLLCFNLENFFLTSESLAPSRGLVNLKDSQKVEDIARMLKEIDVDICAFSEVGGRSSLEHFNEKYLDSKYEIQILEGNSDRGIEIGYLVKKEISFNLDLITHKDKILNFIYPNDLIENEKAVSNGQPLVHENQKFSRNVLELQLKEKNTATQFNIFLVHFKSQWDRRGDDFRGQGHRKAEAEALAEIVKERQTMFPDAHMILTGDFNGRVKGEQQDPEFESLRKMNFIDVLEHKDLPQAEKFTMAQFNQGQREMIQLDYILLEEKTRSSINKDKSGLVRFKDNEGNQIPLPKTLYDRNRLPSDHYPLLLTLDVR